MAEFDSLEALLGSLKAQASASLANVDRTLPISSYVQVAKSILTTANMYGMRGDHQNAYLMCFRLFGLLTEVIGRHPQRFRLDERDRAWLDSATGALVERTAAARKGVEESWTAAALARKARDPRAVLPPLPLPPSVPRPTSEATPTPPATTPAAPPSPLAAAAASVVAGSAARVEPAARSTAVDGAASLLASLAALRAGHDLPTAVSGPAGGSSHAPTPPAMVTTAAPAGSGGPIGYPSLGLAAVGESAGSRTVLRVGTAPSSITGTPSASVDSRRGASTLDIPHPAVGGPEAVAYPSLRSTVRDGATSSHRSSSEGGLHSHASSAPDTSGDAALARALAGHLLPTLK